MSGLVGQTVSSRISYIIAGIIGAAPSLFGSVHETTTLVLLAAVCVAGFFLSRGARGNGEAIDFHPLLLLGAAATTLLVFQVLPLPSWLVSLLSPKAHQIQTETGEAIPIIGVWTSLSLEPVATLWEAARLAGYCVLFWVVFVSASNDRIARRVQNAVALAGTLLVALGALQLISDSDRILGIYSSPDVRNLLGSKESLGFVTPLMNGNHAAGLMVLSAMVYLGLSLGTEREPVKHLPFLGFLVCSVGVLATRSRGGLLSLAAGILLFAAIRFLGPRFRKMGSRNTLLTVLIGVSLFLSTTFLLLASYGLFVLNPINSSLLADPGSELKFQLWENVIPMLSDFVLFGIGRGAFPSVSSAYLGESIQNVAWYAECLPLQILVDIGPLIGTLFMVTALALLVPILFTGLKYSRWLGMTTGLLALGIHNLVDFSLEITGVAVPAIATIAVLAARVRLRREKRHRTTQKHQVGRKVFATASLVSLAFLLIATLWSGHSGIRTSHSRIMNLCLPGEESGRSMTNGPECMDLVRQSLFLHPANSHLFKVGGAASLSNGDLSTARTFIDRSIRLCPRCLQPRLLSADLYLSEERPDEAARVCSELFTLFSDQRHALNTIYSILMTSGRSPEELAGLFLGHPQQSDAFVTQLIRNGRQEAAMHFLLELLRHEGKQPNRLLRLGILLLSRGKVEKAERLATEILGLFPDSPDGYALQGMVDARRHNCINAITMLREARLRRPSHLQIALSELRCLAIVGTFEEFDRLAGQLRRRVDGSKGLSYEFHRTCSKRYLREKRFSEALHELDLASLFRPSTAKVSLERGHIFYKLGDFQRAAQAFREVLRLQPGNRQARNMLEKLEIR